MKKQEGTGAVALQFLTLCASRTSEVREATWSEINFDSKLWIIPATRMKAKREHRVPLSSAAIEILGTLPRFVGSDLIFPGARGSAMSNMTMAKVMRAMHDKQVGRDQTGWVDPVSRDPAVPHGLRSTFRDWAAEEGIARDLAEFCLAHDVGTDVERAYRRTDMVEQRRAVMEKWANACAG